MHSYIQFTKALNHDYMKAKDLGIGNLNFIN